MRVFVAGGTGAIGRPLLHRLLEAGHEVTAMTRSPEKGAALRAAGVDAAVCDAFDVDGVHAAVTDDLPVATREWIPAMARAMGAGKPRRVPLWLAKLIAGPMAVTMVDGPGQSNAQARAQLGWAPAHPTYREGFPAVFGAAR